MNKVCVIQYAWGPEFLHQTQITNGYTLWGCSKYSYDYRFYTRKPSISPVWEKPKLLLETLRDDYETVIWLDTDCLWLANEPIHNLHSTVFGMSYHHSCLFQHTDHYNAGVISIKNSDTTIKVMNEWLNESDDGHPWAEQYALNKILKRNPELVCKLDHKFNSVYDIPDYSSDNPVIVAWHGSNNRNKKMIDYIKGLNNDRN